jgi:mono/diheme cytochrome c family protein
MPRQLLFVVACAALIVAAVTAQDRRPTPPVAGARIDSIAGVDSYAFYCVGCHGATGQGNGTVASSLTTPVPDLTTLSARNGGSYPRSRIRGAILNIDRPIGAHGNDGMPVWGAIFTALDGSGWRSAARVEGLVAFVETLQRPLTPSFHAGRELYLAHCASCHGPNGAGDGPRAGEIDRPIPDLTTFTARNGGVFPSSRLEQIIDGRGVAAHGPSDMPIWGRVFSREPGADAAEAAARIKAITEFLDAIQRRRT